MVTSPIFRVNPHESDPAVCRRGIEVLEAGGLVVAPTETRYGLLARADAKMPADRLAHAKQRASSKPISIFAGSVELIMHFATLDPVSLRLARIFLPGPLTLVLPAIGTWHPMIAPAGKIGIRVSSSPVIQAIMERVDFPVTATSANISGDEENETVEQIMEAFGADVDLYIDGGALTGPPSSVVDCTVSPPRILREGAIDPEAIEQAIGVSR